MDFKDRKNEQKEIKILKNLRLYQRLLEFEKNTANKKYSREELRF